MRKSVILAAIALTACGPAESEILGYTRFDADPTASLVIYFRSNGVSRPQECVDIGGLELKISVTGKNRGEDVADGCWKIQPDGQIKMILYGGDGGLNGTIFMKKERMQKL